MRRFAPPAPLSRGDAARNSTNSTKGPRPWARRAPPKLVTSSFLGGGGAWKGAAPARPRASSTPRVANPRAAAMAKRCRAVAAAAGGDDDDAASVSTEADASLVAASVHR